MPSLVLILLSSASYTLRKVLLFLSLPFGLCACLLIVALITRRWRFTAAALAVMLVASTPVIADRLVDLLEGQHPRIPLAACPAADGIVVLGGIVSHWLPGGRLEWSDAVDRFEAGIGLWHAGKAPLLYLGGGVLESDGSNRTEAQAMRGAAVGRGVPPGSIRLLPDVEVTADEAQAVSVLAQEEGVERVILVTSAFHMPRAVYLFERTGLDVIPFPVDYFGREDGEAGLLDVIPRGDTFSKTEIALKELYGLVYYRLLGARR
jgi:uncharacterized SAM-binding protein YcdF (DUF218 family)